MGRHNVPHGEKSSYGQANGSPGTSGYKGKHRAEDKMTPLSDRPKLDETTQIVNGGWFGKKK